jgi:hypothetical protein
MRALFGAFPKTGEAWVALIVWYVVFREDGGNSELMVTNVRLVPTTAVRSRVARSKT